MPVLRSTPAWLALLLGLAPAFAGSAAADGSPGREMASLVMRTGAAPEDANQARVIVQYKASSNLMQALSASAGNGSGRVGPQHAGVLGLRLGLPLQNGRVLGERMQALRGQGLSSRQLAAQLQLQDDVEWAVVDGRRTISTAPNDPYYGPNQTSITPAVGQWYLRAPDAAVSSASKPVVASINAEAAWALSTGKASVTVAVLDTGVRPDHPDFIKADGSSKLWPGYDFISDPTESNRGGATLGPGAADPGDWTTTGECGNDPATGRPIPGSGSSWHGTQTASLVGAATDNGVGMASIGRDVMVLPVRVLGKCGGSDSDIIAAMYWAAGLPIPGDSVTPANPHPAQVISMSLGGSGSCPSSFNAVFLALAANKVTVVVAAGNDEGLAVAAPANCPGALAVTGVRHIGTKVGFSNIGPEVAIASPAGNCVSQTGSCLYPMLTATNQGTTTPISYSATPQGVYTNGTNYSVGTSFSTPLVAGTAGLMLSVDPTLTPAKLKSVLQSSARPFPTSGVLNANGTPDTTVVACKAPSSAVQDQCYCTTSTCGAGLLDAGAAVAAVMPISPPTTGITASSSSPTAGLSVTLSANGAAANGGRSIAGYQWAISSGAAYAAFSGSTTGASATLLTSAAGTVVVSLTITDSAGATGSASTTVSVQAAPPVNTSPAPTGGGTAGSSNSGGGGGGGAMSAVWVVLLGLAAWALRRTRRA